MSDARHVDAVASRLSLRAPQRESLAILARVCERIELSKSPDLDAALRAVQAEYGQVTSFDRDFPSLCFALATGVGKTRLMGAFIAWLLRARNVHNFFVLAPNLTIYEKLIRDFTPGNPKYVFTGLSEFASTPPEIITGDNYESGRGVREGQMFAEGVFINVFNISKINAEVRGGNVARIKRLAEYIGKSYFEYLSELPDLVLLMDESHRYRASAGVRAINELKPVLGLELTATPQVEKGGKAEPFRNVVYSYPLASALADGFVKAPAVVTREDFDAKNYDEAQLERLKLEDAVHVHEATKVELEVYARNQGVKLTKPFVLVVAADTTHAEALLRLIEAPDFFGGSYAGKVVTVHSNKTGEEKDEVVAQLLEVEDAANPIEIVIHVNMLKEGWDVTNLYTIVPLRAANSRTLVEQSIGRGLRLPYGLRTGVSAVDRLNIVAHDRFQEIVDHANDPNSIIRQQVVLSANPAAERMRVEEIEPAVFARFRPQLESGGAAGPQQAAMFASPRAQLIAELTMQVLPEFERLASSRDLLKPEVQAKIAERVRQMLPPATADFTAEPLQVAQLVKEVAGNYGELSIDIPRVLVLPKSDVKGRYDEFQLDLARVGFQAVESDILIHHLENNRQERLTGGDGVVLEQALEHYVVRGLIALDDVSYDDNADVLNELAAQVVRHLRSYLPDEDAVANVLQFHQRALRDVVHSQMQAHYREAPVEYEARVTAGFRTFKSSSVKVAIDEASRDFRAPVAERQRIREMVFGGFQKSVYPRQKFQSDSERRFAVVLENDASVRRWLKPMKDQLLIHLRDGSSHLPDFVIETDNAKYLCEVKAADEVASPEVQEKARAAITWCRHASVHAAEHGNKSWTYALIPHDEIGDQRTLASLVAVHSRTE